MEYSLSTSLPTATFDRTSASLPLRASCTSLFTQMVSAQSDSQATILLLLAFSTWLYLWFHHTIIGRVKTISQRIKKRWVGDCAWAVKSTAKSLFEFHPTDYSFLCYDKHESRPRNHLQGSDILLRFILPHDLNNRYSIQYVYSRYQMPGSLPWNTETDLDSIQQYKSPSTAPCL